MRQVCPDHPPKTPTTTSGQVGSGQVTAGQAIRFARKKNRNESDFEYGFVKVPGKANKVQVLYEGAYGKA